jgi:hypothetical protein
MDLVRLSEDQTDIGSLAGHARAAEFLRRLLWVFFAAGLARLVSMATHAVPPPAILALLATEIALPPLLRVWLLQVLRAEEPRMASARLHPGDSGE